MKERIKFDPRMTIFDIKDGKEIRVEYWSLDNKDYYESCYLDYNVLLAYLEDKATQVVEKSLYMVDMIIERL